MPKTSHGGFAFKGASIIKKTTSTLKRANAILFDSYFFVAMEMERSWKSPNQVQKPPERPDGPALANTTKDSWDAASPPPSKAPAPAPAEVPAQSVEVTSKWERRRMEKLKDRRLSHG